MHWQKDMPELFAPDPIPILTSTGRFMADAVEGGRGLDSESFAGGESCGRKRCFGKERTDQQADQAQQWTGTTDMSHSITCHILKYRLYGFMQAKWLAWTGEAQSGGWNFTWGKGENIPLSVDDLQLPHEIELDKPIPLNKPVVLVHFSPRPLSENDNLSGDPPRSDVINLKVL